MAIHILATCFIPQKNLLYKAQNINCSSFKINSHHKYYVSFFIVTVCVYQIRNLLRYSKPASKSQGRCKTFQMLQCIAHLCIPLFPNCSCYSFQHKLYNICTMCLYIYFTFREDLVSPPPVLVGSRCSSFQFYVLCFIDFFPCSVPNMVCFSGLPSIDASSGYLQRSFTHLPLSIDMLCIPCLLLVGFIFTIIRNSLRKLLYEPRDLDQCLDEEFPG